MPYNEKTRKYTPNGERGQCQCVRNHSTLIDGDISQCGAGITDEGHNGLCEGCWNTHGQYLIKNTAKADR
jgi:hypothetical protein